MDDVDDRSMALAVKVDLAINFIGPNVTTEPFPDTPKYIDDTTTFYFKILMYCSLCAAVSLVGIVTNILNIVVFLRQGIFAESNVLSLFSLAISDFCCVATMLWLSIALALALADLPDWNWEPFDVMYLTAAWPHLLFAQITRMITAYVAFERCMCVVFPFKVRTWFTPKRSLAIIVCIFMYCLITYSPLFVCQQLRFRPVPGTNLTKLVLVFTKNRDMVMGVAFQMSSVVNIGSVGVVLLCTMITVSRVNLSRAWRETVANATNVPGELNQDTSSTMDKPKKQKQVSQMGKERKMVKMVSTISLIFLLCYAPDFIYFITYLIKPNIRVLGPNENLAYVMYSFTYLTETINSSINIFVYYSMSSRYKQVMKSLLSKSADKRVEKTAMVSQ